MESNQSHIPGLDRGIEILAYVRPFVRHCGNHRRPAWRMERRCLLDFLLVYIAEGRGRFEVGETSYDAGPGDLFWIPPAVPHAMEGFPPSMLCPYVHFDLIYRPEVSHWDFSIPEGMTNLDEFAVLRHPPLPAGPLADLCGKISVCNQRVGDLINEICSEAARAQPYCFLRLSGLMMEILAEILRGQSGLSDQQDEHAPMLEKAAEFLRNNSHKNISVEQAAEVAGLSPSYFRHLFSVHYHCSPRDYLTRTRTRKAKELMIGNNLTISQIADRVGYATVHCFSRVFKAVEGLSPSQYRSYGSATLRVEGRKPFG